MKQTRGCRLIVGAQWGDEGKGKIVDHLSEKVDIVARYQGGANAGHTVVFPAKGLDGVKNKSFVLHLIPSGIFHRYVTCVIGNGVVLDVAALITEINLLREFGVRVEGRLIISQNAHLIMPYHKLIDAAREQGEQKIGTTGRGIGPAYIDKCARTGIRVVDLFDRDTLYQKVKRNVEEKNLLLSKIYNSSDVLNTDEITQNCQQLGDQLRVYARVTDVSYYLNEALKKKKRVLAEGAQGALLDVDHGTYPFVTSSSPTSGGVCTGLGIPPTAITSIIGVVKAYTTRVGNGPFPTELDSEIGNQLRKTGNEFGATTGRPRRCGWLDLIALRYAVRVNGIQKIAMTKLDVLDRFDWIGVCVGYKIDGKRLRSFPTDVQTLERVVPEYRMFKGWKAETTDVRSYAKLPPQAKKYIEFIVSALAPVWMVSVGQGRDQTIMVR